ncbi:MAG: UDP-N-acetylmuramate--L-alanine ligase [Elusimicrobiota bacterium]|jgi:UDP-N-acetylmuramate--alanine ligase|nr:UDP-N-acetylmuramate--L-alanine ligase [Elusimicrobiota bacterium]
MFNKPQNIHFVGIGGSGMSGIAEVLINLGHRVSGSDLKKSETTDRLKSLGAKIFIGHNKKNIKNASVIVTSTAVHKDNPEVKEALKRKIPAIRRIEMLAELARLKYTIAVAGSHGKTTATSLVSLVLSEGGLDPTIIIGGRLKNLDTGAKLGQGQYLVAEADESDGSFLKLSPVITIVTNIDNDHLDYYKTMDNLKNAFVEHINSVPFYGAAIICADDKVVSEIIPKIARKYITYGLNQNADLQARNIKISNNRNLFDAFYLGKKLGRIVLKVPGRHNVLNSLAAVAVGIMLGIPFKKTAQALYSFDGVGRRLEVKGSKNGILIIDDYGHHPSEIKAVLKAVKDFWGKRRLIVLFQPHRYTRTQLLFKDFGKSFENADIVRILDIYPAGEKPIKNISSSLILKETLKNKTDASKYEGAKDFLKILRAGDIVLTLGAGDIWKEGEKLLTLI